MRYLLLALLAILFTACPSDDDNLLTGSSISVTRLAIYEFDVNVDFVAGEDNFSDFVENDSTLILQITRTVDPDIGLGGDESYETIYIILPVELEEIDISGSDWDDIKTFAFTNERTVNAPVGRVTGGSLIGQRVSFGRDWQVSGQVELSENFGPTFPLDLTGTFSAR